MAKQSPVYDPQSDERGVPTTGRDIAPNSSSASGDSSDPRDGSSPAPKKRGFGFSSSSRVAKRGVSASATTERPDFAAKEELDKAESGGGGGLYTPGSDDESGSAKTKRKRSFWTRKRVAFGVSASVLTIGGFSGFSVVQGPLQLVHVSQILSRNFNHDKDSSSTRTRQLYKLWRTGDVGETRVGALGSKVFAKTIKQLSDIGVTYDRDSFSGKPKTVRIDTEKLEKKFPELKNMNLEQQRAFLAQQLEIDPAKLQKYSSASSGSGHKFGINSRDMGIKETTLLKNNTLAFLDDGSITSSMKSRVLGKYFNLPSIWHPYERVKAALENKYGVNKERARKEREEKRAKKASQPPESSKLKEARAKINDKLTKSGAVDKAGKALLVTGMACVLRDVSTAVIDFNDQAVAKPAAAAATSAIAGGSQVQSGDDIALSQAGDTVTQFTDSKTGQDIYDAKAFQATANPKKTAGGEDLSEDYRQAFTGGTTAESIQKYVELGGATGIACSKAGLIVQGVVAAGIIIIGIPTTGGTASAAYIGEQAARSAATMGVLYMLQKQFTKMLATDAVVPAIMSGAKGGNLLAYGAREAANMSARSSGGIALKAAEVSRFESKQEEIDKKELRSKSFLAQIFDVHDYRTPAAKFGDSLSPDPGTNFAKLSSAIFSFSSLRNAFSLFFPQTQAAAKPYDWGFDSFGIPDEIMNDPQLQDPYDNAKKVIPALESGDYNSRAKKCFGVEITDGSDGWDVENGDEDVNPKSQDYLDASCDDLSDYNWKRIILFIFDTRTMKAVACFEGDEDVCGEMGFQGSSESSSAGGSQQPEEELDMATLFESSVDIECAEGTDDVGVQDGYHEHKKIRIRTCAIPNIASSATESKNGKLVVNSRVSKAVFEMAKAAKADGVVLTANSGFRSMATQECLAAGGCGATGEAAAPGTSNHQMGLAIDFGGIPTTPAPGSGPVWNWLDKNAKSYSYKNYPAEAWHWSPTGN